MKRKSHIIESSTKKSLGQTSGRGYQDIESLIEKMVLDLLTPLLIFSPIVLYFGSLLTELRKSEEESFE